MSNNFAEPPQGFVAGGPKSRETQSSKYLSTLLKDVPSGKGFYIPLAAVNEMGLTVLAQKMNYYGKKRNCRFSRKKQADGSIYIYHVPDENSPDPVGMNNQEEAE